MKKVLSTIMALLIATGLSACGCGNGTDNNTGAGAGADKENSAGTNNNKENNGTGTNNGTNNGTPSDGTGSSNEKKTYKDGTYTAAGETWEYGSEEAVVTVKDGKITNIELKRLDKEGNEVDYSQWTGKEVNGTTYPNLNKFRKDMAQVMVDSQSANADVISGATVSCQNWIIAVQRALDEASM